jgi:type VI secretion system secreted protein VgrG
VGKRLLASVRDGIRHFSRRAGIRLIAAADDIDIRAVENCIHLTAKKIIRKEGNRIILQAKEELLLIGGGSYLKLNAQGIEYGTAKHWEVHAKKQKLAGPESMELKVHGFTTSGICLSCLRKAAYFGNAMVIRE